MNDYRITYTTEAGDSFDSIITERTEAAARKFFTSMNKGLGFTVTSIELHRENACATKQQERDALAAIRKMVEELGPQSYLATAFQGCFEDAESNIENDFGDSMKGRVESAEKKVSDLKAKVKELEEKLRQEIAEKQQARDEAQEVIKKLEKKTLGAEDLERVIVILEDRAGEAEAKAEKDAVEIVRLAEAPTSGEFRKAVAMHRNHSTYAKSCRDLMDRVAAVQTAVHSKDDEKEAC